MTDNSVTRGVSGAFNKTTQKVSDGVKPHTAEPVDQLSLSKATKASPDMYVSVARLQEKNGNDDEAITMYKRALGVDPDHIVALVNLGRILDRKGNLDEAIKYYQHAARKYPKEAGVLNDLGLCYARQGKYEDALGMFRRAIDLQPEKALYRNNLATILCEVDRVEEAVAQLEAVHGKAIAHYNVGILLNRRGRDVAAIYHFRLAANADPTFEPAQQWLAAIENRGVEQPVASVASSASSVVPQRALEQQQPVSPQPSAVPQPAQPQPAAQPQAAPKPEPLPTVVPTPSASPPQPSAAQVLPVVTSPYAAMNSAGAGQVSMHVISRAPMATIPPNTTTIIAPSSGPATSVRLGAGQFPSQPATQQAFVPQPTGPQPSVPAADGPDQVRLRLDANGPQTRFNTQQLPAVQAGGPGPRY
jgi:Tfp pilus assembly protein PilF